MSEFNPTAESKISAPPRPPKKTVGPSIWQRPLLLGLSLPWLTGAVLILGLAGWYLFAPEPTSQVNRLAFKEDFVQQPLTAPGSNTAPVTAKPGAADLTQFKNEVASMVGGVRTYAEVNRTAIERLSETVKAQGAAVQTLRQQLAEAQAQNSLFSARLSFLEGRPGALATAQPVAQPAARKRSPLTGMQVQAIQNGMAWVYWQNQTWAVKEGDPLGPVTITRIDASARQVQTSAGTLK